MQASATEPSPDTEMIIDMAQVTDFVANDGCLQLFFNDGTGYYREKNIDATMEDIPDGYIPLDDSIVYMDAVIDFSATEYGLQLYFEDGSGYFLAR